MGKTKILILNLVEIGGKIENKKIKNKKTL